MVFPRDVYLTRRFMKKLAMEATASIAATTEMDLIVKGVKTTIIRMLALLSVYPVTVMKQVCIFPIHRSISHV